MGYRAHYATSEWTMAALLTPERANELLDPEEPLTGPYVLVLSDEGNQERFVLEGTGEQVKTMLDSLTRQLAGVWPNPADYTE
jgi:hypothetical protein